jgi:two-component system, OmpR family, sensor histidine kinase KdpD
VVEDRADTFLRMIRRSQRGRLKVYLGYCAGVGKTYQMLEEGHRLKAEGIDVVIGLLEAHGRADITKLAVDLEIIPKRRQEYRGVMVEEMDVEAILTRKPQVALIDELAHTNVPGSQNAKRYQDVQDIITSGIHVVTTMNVQHLESLYNIVEKAVGVKVWERLPDSILAEADQIVDVDLTTEDLRKRLQEGKIYPPERIEIAMANFFTPSNLEKLRELTLRELASQIDLRRRDVSEEETIATPDQVLVCLSSRSPNSEKLLRYSSRLAGELNRNWYAVYVQTPSEEATAIDAQTQRSLSDSLTLAKQLGAMVFTYKGEDVADTILQFAKEYRVGHIVIGRSNSKPFWKRFGKNKDILGDLVKNARGVTIVVLDTREGKPFPSKGPIKISELAAPVPPGAPSETLPHPLIQPVLSQLLSPERIMIWERPVKQEAVLWELTKAIWRDTGFGDIDELFKGVLRREQQGSTFFNEGAAFPHIRIDGLRNSVVALGLTKKGVLDVSAEKPIEIVFLILSPIQTPDTQIQVLSLASRAAQNRYLIRSLRSARNPEEAIGMIRNWEMPNE